IGTPDRDVNVIKAERIVADHMKSAVFLLTDGIRPSNVLQGYILRRIIRRSIRYAKMLGLPADFYADVIDEIIKIYDHNYPDILKQKDAILDELQKEIQKFEKAVEHGIKKFEEFYNQKIFEDEASGAKCAFELYETYGFPFELTEELVKERGGKLNKNLFEDELSRHQEISRAGVEKKFGGHGLKLDTGELKAASEEELKKVTRLHSATHLLHAGLRKVLGDTIQQRGSDITAERLRFDFLFDRKLTDEEKAAVEEYVNDAVTANVEMIHKDAPYEEAIASGFLAFFRGKYPAIVSTYELPGWSKEVCGGPHVSRSGEVGKFRIIKDEASSAGVRRIRATVE
ncbi:MAG: alanine--tRNA ligase-related protein, partial [Patescibacteria group bacterium]